VFVDPVPAQHKGLQQVLRDFPADVIIGDDMMFGVLPMLLGPRAKRPAIVLCGTSILHWRREDGAPYFAGLPPATTSAQLKEYAAIAQEHDRIIYEPMGRCLNRSLKDLGVGPLSTPPFDSGVELADAYLQLTAPSFEFPRELPPSVHFVGAPPIIPNQAAAIMGARTGRLAQGCPGHTGNRGKSRFQPLDRPDACGACERT